MTTVEELYGRGVDLLVLAGAEIDTTANDRLVFGIFAALAEFERELIAERPCAGLVAARARGRTGGRPRRMHVIMVHTAMRSMADRDTKDMFLTAISEAELLYGVAIVPAGKRRIELKAVMIRWPGVGFGERILPFDSAAARYYAEIVSRCRREGRPIQEADCQIAVISRSRSAVLATRNVRDFESIGVNVVDPWTVVRN